MFKELLEKAFDLGVQLIIALLVIIIGFKIIKVLEKSLKKKHKLTKMDDSVKSFLISIMSIALKIVLFVVAASIVGIPTTSFITILGSAGLAVGLALQGGLSNLAGGVMILLFKPFRVGDYIEAGGKEGVVKSITMFYTALNTLDNKVIQIPNGSLTNSTITNYTANPERRVDLEFNVSYDTKIDKVKKVVNDTLDKCEYILEDSERTIRLLKHSESSLTFAVRVWVKKENYWNTYFELQESIKEAFDKNNIVIPFPQLDIHQK